eukprot:TRINITY_DN11695_c0_g1_i1.p1 TRINITY_DN11695_c0_g1~~TRINITY_DN11695_c0_g1_i1.p1  ORF type:complete len:266 (-),score=85.18 TRINITY_DN11695_c0_g1_i1:61-858(-)
MPSKRKLVCSGDSKSLWNSTLSPGWTEEESGILHLAIMKFGLGRWKDIIDSGCLPGKTPSQLNIQSQRLLGQQSTGEFMGIQLDTKEVWNENHKKVDVMRKNGCIINTGNNPTREERLKKIAENRAKWGLPKAKIDSIILPNLNEQARAQKQNRLNLLREHLTKLSELLKEKLEGNDENETATEEEKEEEVKEEKADDNEEEEEEEVEEEKEEEEEEIVERPQKRTKVVNYDEKKTEAKNERGSHVIRIRAIQGEGPVRRFKVSC